VSLSPADYGVWGERRELPQRGLGRSLGRKPVFVHLELKEHI